MAIRVKEKGNIYIISANLENILDWTLIKQNELRSEESCFYLIAHHEEKINSEQTFNRFPWGWMGVELVLTRTISARAQSQKGQPAS